MLSKIDLAKYPFIKETSEYIEKFDFKIEDFESSDYDETIDKATLRIKDSVSKPLKHIHPIENEDLDTEILSFPIAILMMKNIRDTYFQKRFALAESKRASANLELESVEKIIEIASKNFRLNISKSEKSSEILKMGFSNYLINASKFHEDKWKLVNRYLELGDVIVTKREAVRILEEEIRNHIQSKFENGTPVTLPQNIKNRISKLEKFFEQHKKKIPIEQSLGKIDFEFFPPCMFGIHLDTLSGKNVPHFGRFSLTAFLINIGMNKEDIIKMYTAATDFDENTTRYQVLHIAGLTGGKTKYKPLKCANMQTHRLCINPNEICKRISNPLTYYKIVYTPRSKVKS